jgi:transposase
VLTLPSSVRIFVAAEPVDLRRGFDGLAAATRAIILQDPLNGHVFAFLNRRVSVRPDHGRRGGSAATGYCASVACSSSP